MILIITSKAQRWQALFFKGILESSFNHFKILVPSKSSLSFSTNK